MRYFWPLLPVFDEKETSFTVFEVLCQFWKFLPESLGNERCPPILFHVASWLSLFPLDNLVCAIELDTVSLFPQNRYIPGCPVNIYSRRSVVAIASCFVCLEANNLHTYYPGCESTSFGWGNEKWLCYFFGDRDVLRTSTSVWFSLSWKNFFVFSGLTLCVLVEGFQNYYGTLSSKATKNIYRTVSDHFSRQ